MSTDLHLHHQLPKLRISAVKLDDDNDNDNDNDDIPSSESDHTPVDNRNMSTVITPIENENVDAAIAVAGSDADDNDESYKTPTSKESKIPEILTCPPAPRKPKPFVSCKRKLLDEFQFFEVTSNEDMDAFFRSTFPKRTCPCT